jgi:hypothetical protein
MREDLNPHVCDSSTDLPSEVAVLFYTLDLRTWVSSHISPLFASSPNLFFSLPISLSRTGLSTHSHISAQLIAHFIVHHRCMSVLWFLLPSSLLSVLSVCCHAIISPVSPLCSILTVLVTFPFPLSILASLSASHVLSCQVLLLP